MTTKYTQTRDINGYNGFALPISDTAYSATLAAATDTTLTVPSTIGVGKQGPATKAQSVAIIKYTPAASVWVAVGATAAVPAGASFAATGSLLNPESILVSGGDVLHFFTTPANVNVSIAFYSIA